MFIRRSLLHQSIDAAAEYRKPTNQRLIDDFHRLYYFSLGTDKDATSTFWLGQPVWKTPLDLWVFQEIIAETKPDVIIEAGTYKGGSAFYMASVCDLLNHGRVITMDIKEFPGRPAHPRITYLIGNDIAGDTVAKVKALIKPSERIMVVLDDGHEKEQVLSELRIYGDMVTTGNYVIVEDTNRGSVVRIHPGERSGPLDAVEQFLKETDKFTVDSSREKFLLTFNHKGYLKRVK